jgi:Putative Ig domain
VGSGLAFTSDSAVTAASGVAFSFTVATTGSLAPTLSRTGSLPSGLSFKDRSGGTAIISGTPASSASGIYPLTFTAKNKSRTATLTVTRGPTIKKIPTTTADVGVALNLAIKTAGYPASALTESGLLPNGLRFAANQDGTAAITGVPAQYSGGTYAITVTATNSSGTASQSFTLNVNEAPAITSSDTPTAVTGSPFSFQATARGFPAPKIAEA